MPITLLRLTRADHVVGEYVDLLASDAVAAGIRIQGQVGLDCRYIELRLPARSGIHVARGGSDFGIFRA